MKGEHTCDGYYYWKVTSKSVVNNPYGDWRYEPSGKGTATLSFSNSSTYSTSVTNTISGSYTSVSTIASSLGVTIGTAKTYSASYSVAVPSGKTILKNSGSFLLYIVSVSGEKLVSKISETQKKLLERLGLKLEAD